MPVRLSQPLKAFAPTPVMPDKLRFFSEEQPLNAFSPMTSTHSGTTTLARFTHPSKVLASTAGALGRITVTSVSFPLMAPSGNGSESSERSSVSRAGNLSTISFTLSEVMSPESAMSVTSAASSGSIISTSAGESVAPFNGTVNTSTLILLSATSTV